MTAREWARLILVLAACNGWWAFATWPSLGGGGDPVGPLLLLGIGPTVWICIWFLAWLNDYWYKD